MKALIRIRAFRALCVLLAVAGQTEAILAQNGPPNKDRYLIVLKPPKNGVPELSDHDITAGGGKIEYKVPGRIQVTLPAPAVEALRKQERVKYIEKVILGPVPDASAPAKLRMTPSTASLRATAESTPPTWRSGTYKYDASGNIYAIGVAGDTGSPVQHRYAYDELSHLKRADTFTTPTTHTETFTYDVYGNLIEHVDGSSTTPTPVEDPNTNRLAPSAAHPYTYDAAGNLTADYNVTYEYDPFSMLREKDRYPSPATQEFYIYTASDERIGVKYGTSSGSPTIWSIRHFSGNVLRQYEGHDQSPQMAWLWVEDYVYRDGQLLAAERVPEEGGRRHFHLDHLGSPRLVTGQNSKEMSEHDYEPFGLESNYQETAGGFDREDPKRFTGHERDYAPPGESPASTAYLDYMHARYYSANVGRVLSVDPTWDSADLARPQAWNRYAYVQNNPMGKVDPDGRDTWDLISGVANAIGSDNLIGAGRVSGGNYDFQAGQDIGDFVASVGGLVEAGAGTSIGAVGVAFDATGFGAIVGVPANVAGATMIVHGATTAVVGTIHMSESAGGPKAGSSGGPGAGKDFSKGTKDTARAESNNKCVFCGKDTTRQPGGNQSNIDHADPKARGGNNTPANAQNTCRTCNLQRATKTSSEFLNWLKSMF
jgi:RHS repeat-associated protein